MKATITISDTPSDDDNMDSIAVTLQFDPPQTAGGKPTMAQHMAFEVMSMLLSEGTNVSRGGETVQ